MIRFCRKKVYYVEEDTLSRKEVEAYLNKYDNELICIVDKFGKFIGIVTYYSIIQRSSSDYIIRDYVLLDENIWTNGRRYFSNCYNNDDDSLILPVLNNEHTLVCFAWQDKEANREIRMLDELMICEQALDFKEIYPNRNCVRIHGCNELAFYFANYLRKLGGIKVYVDGMYWKVFNEWKDSLWCEEKEVDEDIFVIYSEGFSFVEEEMLNRSVSSEFECINKIYEINFSKGIIKNANKDFHKILKEELKGKRIGILGIGLDALNAYDLLLKYGVDIYCFVSCEQHGHRKLFGKNIINKIEVLKQNVDILIEGSYKYSAWGFGGGDEWHYLGYLRNRRFFLLGDYVRNTNSGLINIFKNIMKNPLKRLILAGEPRLCLKLNQVLEFFKEENMNMPVYCDVTGEYAGENINMRYMSKKDLNLEDVCILLLPDYYGRSYRVLLVQTYAEELWKNNLTDYVDYPLNNEMFLSCENMLGMNPKRVKSNFKVGKILLGSINAFSGNCFFRGILDDHPDILTMHGNYIGCNLFSICIRLAMEKSSNILSLFWKIYDEESDGYFNTGITGFPDKDKFNQSMDLMLGDKDEFTSYELFVMLHISYARMWGKKIKDLSKMVIYWEPHDAPKNIIENYATWLQYACDSGYIINIVRNAYIRAGSYLRWASQAVWPTKEEKFLRVLEYPNQERKDISEWKRICMRFEDLKTDAKGKLQDFCDETGIVWSDTMLDVKTQTSYGSSTGFDLFPVYRIYEEYFSTFDRFRISLITSAWQKKYDYPYVSSRCFSRRELVELFTKKFRFEENWTFCTEKEKIEFNKRRQRLINDYLWINRTMEDYV